MWESAHRRVGSARGRLGARAIPLRSAAPPTHRTLGLLTAGLVAWCWMGALRCEGSHLHAAVRLRVQCSGSCSSGALGTLLRGSPPFEAFRRPPPVVVRWRSVGRKATMRRRSVPARSSVNGQSAPREARAKGDGARPARHRACAFAPRAARRRLPSTGSRFAATSPRRREAARGGARRTSFLEGGGQTTLRTVALASTEGASRFEDRSSPEDRGERERPRKKVRPSEEGPSGRRLGRRRAGGQDGTVVAAELVRAATR